MDRKTDISKLHKLVAVIIIGLTPMIFLLNGNMFIAAASFLVFVGSGALGLVIHKRYLSYLLGISFIAGVALLLAHPMVSSDFIKQNQFWFDIVYRMNAFLLLSLGVSYLMSDPGKDVQKLKFIFIKQNQLWFDIVYRMNAFLLLSLGVSYLMSDPEKDVQKLKFILWFLG